MTHTVDELDGSEPADKAIELLVEAYGDRLFSLGVRLCGSRDEAEDLVQETFLQAFRHWDQFEGRARASTWLFTIASRVCQRLHRKRSGEPERMSSLSELLPFAEASMGVVPDGPLNEALRKDAARQVEQAIAELPIEFRMPLVLKEIVGFSLAQIAAILGIKQATVKTRLHRARLRTRKALEEALPKREVPPPIFSKEICLDLLQAKQDSLDHGVPFEFPDQVVCERCAELFGTLDLAREVCQDIAVGEMPPELRRRLAERLAG